MVLGYTEVFYVSDIVLYSCCISYLSWESYIDALFFIYCGLNILQYYFNTHNEIRGATIELEVGERKD